MKNINLQTNDHMIINRSAHYDNKLLGIIRYQSTVQNFYKKSLTQ